MKVKQLVWASIDNIVVPTYQLWSIVHQEHQASSKGYLVSRDLWNDMMKEYSLGQLEMVKTKWLLKTLFVEDDRKTRTRRAGYDG